MSLRSSPLLLVTAAALAVTALVGARPARADTPVPAFGRAGQVVVSDLVGVRSSGLGYLGILSPGYNGIALSGIFGYVHEDQGVSQSVTPFRSSGDTYAVAPAVDVFLSKHLTLGVTLGFAQSETDREAGQTQYQEAQTTRTVTTQFAVAPRVGYVFDLGHGLSLWPRAGAGLTNTRMIFETVSPGPGANAYLLTGRWTAGVDFGVVYRPTEHLYFSAAPEIAVTHSWLETQSPDLSITALRSTAVRVAGSLSMGVILGG